MNLRRLEAKDADGMLSWMHDPDINWVFASDFSAFTREKVLAFIQNSAKQADARHYAVTDSEDRYVGTVSLKQIDMRAGHAEYAISLCKAAHGSGAATFATDAILRVAFAEMQLHRVYLCVREDNLRANRFYQKYGFVKEGCFRGHMRVGDVYRDLIWYGLLKPEWDRWQQDGIGNA